MKTIISAYYFIFFILLSCNDTNANLHAEIGLISERINQIELTLNRIDSTLLLNDNEYHYQKSELDMEEISTEYIINMFLDSLTVVEKLDTLIINYDTGEIIDSSMSGQSNYSFCENLDIEIISVMSSGKVRVRFNRNYMTKIIQKKDIILDKNNEEFEIIEISVVNKNITLRHIQSDLTCIVN